MIIPATRLRGRIEAGARGKVWFFDAVKKSWRQLLINCCPILVVTLVHVENDMKSLLYVFRHLEPDSLRWFGSLVGLGS